MPRKGIDQARINLEQSVALIPSRYEAGVRGADWAGPAGSDAAEANWKAGIDAAAVKKLRQTNIRKVGNAAWQQATIAKGVPIIGSRITGALDKYASRFGPILARVNTFATTLPPRSVDFRANITNRLTKIVEEWKRASGKA